MTGIVDLWRGLHSMGYFGARWSELFACYAVAWALAAAGVLLWAPWLSIAGAAVGAGAWAWFIVAMSRYDGGRA